MDPMLLFHVLLPIALLGLCKVDVTYGLETSFKSEEEKIDLRRELDKMTQALLMMKDPFYHSYAFNSGVGNREKLVVDWMRQESHFTAGKGVVSWQAVRNMGQIHLLGRKLSSVTLVTAEAQLSSNRSAQFHEHSLSFEVNVTSTSLFTRWNPATLEPEVIAVVALDTSAADILFYKTVKGKLELITQWSRYRKVSCLTAVDVNGKNQLIVIDTGSPASIDVFDVLFTHDSGKLDFRLVQSFTVAGECRSTTVCRASGQNYLVLPLARHLVVYRHVSGHYQKHKELSLPQVSQVICFNVALQTYLAINGEEAHVLRLTKRGEFVSELMPGYVSEWLALPVSSYRSDVLLLSRTANLTKPYVWAGANKGFDAVTIPDCKSCLEGDWSGATSIPFQHQNCLLVPQPLQPSSLVTVGTSLNSSNPTLDKLTATIGNMTYYQDEWKQIKSKMAEIEETLRHAVKRIDINVITGKWKIRRLEGPMLRLSSLVKPQNETNTPDEPLGVVQEERAGAVQLETLDSAVQAVVAEGTKLIEAVEERENKAWGLDGFRGKVNFNSRLIVENLTVFHLNNEPMDEILQNSYRKDKPKPIEQMVVETLEAEEIIVKQINDFTSDNLKFSDGPVVMRGDITFESPLTVKGEVELKDGGGVNGVDLSEELCHGKELCSVFPMVNLTEEVREGDFHNNIDTSPSTTPSDHVWSKTIAGRNLTVVKINGVDLITLAQNVIYLDDHQNITGAVVVKGKVSAEPAIWSNTVQYLDHPQSRASDSVKSSPILEAPQSEKRPTSANRETLDDILTASELRVSELEVTGTVWCEESEWGAAASDVVLRDANLIVIEGDKTFSGAVNVTNNAEVEGTIGDVLVSDLLTRDTDQVFYGPTTLHGNITLENITLTGLWNGKNLSDVLKDNSNSYEDMTLREVTADYVNVLESINEIPVSDLLFSGDDVTKVKNMNVEELYVTRDIFVDGKVCNMDLDYFNERRLSLQNEQNISGKVVINKAKITTGFQVKKINNVKISSIIGESEDKEVVETLHLPELHVEGDILTDTGVNGFNITDLAANAIWLEANNEIEGPLIFKDEATFDLVECEGFCNNKMCEYWLGINNVVYKHNKSVTLSGKKRFINLLNISEDLKVQEINGHKIEDILTKTTEQELAGDLSISGDVRIAEDATVLGLLNGQNMTKFGHRCTLSENTISCKGNAVFMDDVIVKHFSSSGKTNEVKFDNFLKSVVRTDEPQRITGFKRFTGNTRVESIENLDRINGESWNDFLKNSVSVGGLEQVDHPITFTETLILEQLSVDYHLEADSVDGINMAKWRTEAIYINNSYPLEREMRLVSASSMGNLSVETYGGLNLEGDIVKLHSASHLPNLRVKSVTVLGDVEVTGLVNSRRLTNLEQNTLKTWGDQTVLSDVGVMGGTVINGSLRTQAPVNQQDLRNIMTLASDQMLHGKYEFDCVEAQKDISSSETISGINLTSWTQTGVMKGGEQEVSGVWRVQGQLDLQGPVRGRGRLAGVDLQQLTDNITRDILEVHHQMKNNLTEACELANVHISLARSQPVKLQYLDVTQTLVVPSGPSLVTHFKSNDEDFLAISEHSCTTTIYKWNKDTEAFASFHRQMMGFSLKKFIILNHEHLTYILTESSELASKCEHSGKNLWIFMEDHFKLVSPVNFFAGDMFQGERNTLYVINPSGMSKFALHFDTIEGKAFFKEVHHDWNIAKDVPMEWPNAPQYDWLSDMYTACNCSGDVKSVSVDPSRQFVAIALAEPAQVPRHADYIKVYRQDGQLYDKLPAQHVHQLQWLAIPTQTWLVSLQNQSTLNLYQLQGPILGFQLQLSATSDATNITTVALPMSSRVNPQPFIIQQSPSAVKILRAFVQGDPYPGDDLTCNFDQVMNRVPRN